MRRIAVLALLAPVLAAAGCGGSKGASGPLDEGLRYLPADAPFAVAIDTKVSDGQYKAADDVARKFGSSGLVEQELKQLFKGGGRVDFDRDVKPLLGNPFVVGAPDPATFGRSGEPNSFVGAIETKDGGKLNDLVKKDGAKQKGEQSGAKVYEDSTGNTFAVKGDVLVVAGSRKLLDDALSRHGGSDTLTEDKFDSALGGLPKDALVRSYLNLESLLRSSPSGRQATKVKWVAALRTLGLVGQARSGSAGIAFNLKTDSAGLTDKDLPIASGDAAPKVVQRAGELSLGLRDPGQIVDFALGAASAIEGPVVDVGERQLEGQLGIDVETDIRRQLTGDASIEITAAGRFGIRAAVKDPAAFKKTLAKVAGALPRVLQFIGAGPMELSKPKAGEDFYALAQPDGGSIVFGVSHGVLVISNDPARARGLATASPTAVSGAKGSLVLSADAEKLANSIRRQLGPLLSLSGGLSTRPLGDLTGSVKTTTSGMKGSLELKFD